MLVLLVEDHHLLAETMMDYLAIEDIQVDYAARGLQGLELATTQIYDAIILDINLPEIDGLSICRQLRENHNIDTPVLMLTARDQLDDKLAGFDVGADDYLIKPFANQELVARLTALVKRQRGEVAQKTNQIGDLVLDSGSQQAWREDKALVLPPISFRILRILMRESPGIVSREVMQQELWGDDVPNTDVLRSHIYNLRKIVDQPFSFAMIQTVKGIGLRLISEND